MDRPKTLKVVLVGDEKTGKSSALRRYIKDSFSIDIKQTIGGEFSSKSLDVNGKNIKLQIWDTAGQERYRGISKFYYRKANIIIFVYDITNRETFTNLQEFVNHAKECLDDNYILSVAGNKSDLIKQRQTSFEEGMSYASEIGASFYEISALTGNSVDTLFNDSAKRIAEQILS
eukprot:403356558